MTVFGKEHIAFLQEASSIAVSKGIHGQRKSTLDLLLPALGLKDAIARLWLFDAHSGDHYHSYTVWNECLHRGGMNEDVEPMLALMGRFKISFDIENPDQIENLTDTSDLSRPMDAIRQLRRYSNSDEEFSSAVKSLLGSDDYRQTYLFLYGPKISFIWNQPATTTEDCDKRVPIGFVEILSTQDISPEDLSAGREIVRIWGEGIQAKRKIRAMDGLEKFVAQVRREPDPAKFVENCCAQLQKIVNCKRVLAIKRVYNKEGISGKCIFDTASGYEEAKIDSCRDVEYEDDTLVAQSFRMQSRHPGVHVTRIKDLQNPEEIKQAFGENHHIKSKDFQNYGEDENLSCLFVRITAQLSKESRHNKFASSAKTQTICVFQLFSKQSEKNLGGFFSDTEQYIISAAAQYIAAKLPSLIFEHKLERLKTGARTSLMIRPLNNQAEETDYETRENRKVRAFLEQATETIDLLSTIYILEQDSLFRTIRPEDNRSIPISYIGIEDGPLPAELENHVCNMTATHPTMIQHDGKTYLAGQLAAGKETSAWAVMELTSPEFPQYGYDLLDSLFTEILTLWSAKRDLGAEKRILLETSHALGSALGAIFFNVSRAQRMYKQAGALSPEEAYEEFFENPSMRRALFTADIASQVAQELFGNERLTHQSITPKDLVREEIEINRLISTVARILKVQAQKRGLEIIVKDHYSSEYKKPYADPPLVIAMLTNLLENAIKHSYRGNKIIIDFGYTRPRWYFAVTNTGPFIPPKFKQQLLEPFFRATPRQGIQSKRGTGLGLAIVHRILKAHDPDGTLGIVSEPINSERTHATNTFRIDMGIR